jgi:hypothetical protein
MNNKKRTGKKRFGAGATMERELWSYLEQTTEELGS